MSELEKIKRHLAKSVPIKLKNEDGCEDIFYLKPLNVEQQAIMIGISKSFQGRTEEELKTMSPEDFKELMNLIKSVVKNSIEGLEDPLLEDFVTSNFDVLSESMINLLPNSSKKDDIEKIKKKMEDIENAKKSAVEQPKE